MTAKTVWVLTAEINEYYQDGEYFVSAFLNKPTFDQVQDILSRYTDATEDLVNYVLKGGGRVGSENSWFLLKEVREGLGYY